MAAKLLLISDAFNRNDFQRMEGEVEIDWSRGACGGEVALGACLLALLTGLARRDDVEFVAETTSSSRSDWEDVEGRRLALLTAGDFSRPTCWSLKPRDSAT